MSRDLLIVTCAEPDALPFLRSLPADYLAGAALVATADVVRAVEKELTVAGTIVISGFGGIEATRKAIGERPRTAVVVVARDPWGPFRGKGFVRARLLAPCFLEEGACADLVELRDRKGWLTAHKGLRRRRLTLRLYAREMLCLTQYLAGVGADGVDPNIVRALGRIAVAVPLSAMTTGRVLLFVARTESLARRSRPRR